MSKIVLRKAIASIEKATISKNEILRIKKIISDETYSIEDIDFLQNAVCEKNGIMLEDKQIKQGLEWLKNLYYTTKGKIKKNAPFCEWYANILNNLEKIELSYFYDISTYNFVIFTPVFKVTSKNGDTFQYFVEKGIFKEA